MGRTGIHVICVEGYSNLTKKVKSNPVGLRVLHDRVLIKPDPPEKYGGDLIIPDAYKAFYENLPTSGVIESFGPQCKFNWVPGQRIHFAKLAGAKLKFMNQEYLIVREYDIDTVEAIS